MIILFFICIIGIFALSGISHALRSLRKGRLEALIKLVGPWLFFPKKEVHALFIAALAAKYLLIFANGIIATIYVLPFTLPQATLLLIVAAALILIIGDVLPKLIITKTPATALKLFAPLASCFLWLTFPFTYFFTKLPISFATVQTPSSHATEDLIEMLEDPKMKASLDPHNKKLITAVLGFKDRIVREVMLPRVSLFSLSHTLTIRQAAEILLVEGYSRIPVYKDSIDSIIGILMYKDIFNLYVKQEDAQLDASIETLLKPVFYTPETKRVSHLLQEFRSKQIHMAVVVDEYGGTEGIVTIEDILEEIVGDIADEYDDAEEALFTPQPGGGWIVDAKMSILDIEENFNLNIPQDADYDTLGGYIYHKAGSIPQKGFCIYHDDFELEVLSSSDRQIDKVRIIPRHQIGDSL